MPTPAPTDPDRHRRLPHYAADRSLILALFGVDGDAVDADTYNAAHERLCAELGLDAGCIEARAKLFVQLGTVTPTREALNKLHEDALHDAGLDDETKTARMRMLLRCQVEDPAITAFTEAQAEPEAEEAADGNSLGALSSLTVADERARDALAMYRRGVTQKDIAAHYGKTDRTIRTWLEHAREVEVAALHAVTPQSAVAEDFDLCTSMIADLRGSYAEARAGGHNRLAVDLSREIRGWSQHQRDLFSAIRLTSLYEHPTARHARYDKAVNDAAEGL